MSIKNTALFAGSLMEYWWRYFSNRRFPKNQQFYVVYTNLDQAIPFQLDTAMHYWLINFKFLPATTRLGDTLPDERFNDIRRAYMTLVRQGINTFREVPTVMPHFAGNTGAGSLPPISFLKQINCSPSLHTAAPFFIYNLSAEYFPEEKPGLRRHIGDIVSTVIKTKKHAMIDIAFGLFLCQKVLENELGLEFRPLEDFFIQEQKARDKIPYEHIYRMYREIKELAGRMGEEANLPEIMESYFREIGLPRVSREKSGCFYDIDRKTLVYPPELKVGKGLF